MDADLRMSARPLLHGRLSTLDALRGFAALSIFIFHFFGLYPTKWPSSLAPLDRIVVSYFGLGVPLFFALSGLSLYIGFFRQRISTNFLRSFFIRRFCRIVPLFYAAVIMSVAIFQSRGARQPLEDILITASLLFGLIPGRHESIVSAGWSVGVEVLFYLAFPLIVVFVTTRRRAQWFYVGACLLAFNAYAMLNRTLPI